MEGVDLLVAFQKVHVRDNEGARCAITHNSRRLWLGGLRLRVQSRF